MWKRILTVSVLFGFCRLGALGVLRFESHSGAIVEITARSLRPGEMLLALFRPAEEGQEARLTFLRKSYDFHSGGPAGKRLALVGVDFLTEPGSYRVEVVFSDTSGRKETVQKYIRLHERSFSRRDIAMDPRLVTPPAELEERLARERTILAEVYRNAVPEWLGSGDFIAPLPDAPKLNFGEHRLYNGVPRSRHTGVDIPAEAGSPIRASNSGQVALAMDLYFSGRTVIINHGLSIFSVYCHCSRLEVRTGQSVARGEVIAAVGSTGRSTGPHLHWSVRARGARVDPYSLLCLGLE
ncbi:MAG: M23 family metallopeptidase [Candidatus Aminicenantes bacterium]|nr:M23 family metallopeptidase [Candidatus Aminicenantes bacterium]